MNIPASLIIVSIILVFSMLFLVVGINETLPAFIRSDYDTICSRYFSQLTIKGGLTTTDINNLKNELANIGLTNIDVKVYLDGNPGIPAPSSIEWGRKATLKISARYDYESIKADGSGLKENKHHILNYENTTVILSLDNE